MSELSKIAAAWSSRPEADRQGALATVIRTHGSTFRRAGARMIIFDDGSTVGSVSGGCLESSIIDVAGDVIRTGTSRALRYDGARDDVILGEGAMCDGEVAICVEKIDETLSESLLWLTQDGHERDVFVTVLDTPRGATTRLESSRQSDAPGHPVLFQERIPPPLRLILCGAGALADAVAGLAESMGWSPVVVDHRPHFLAAMKVPTHRIEDGRDLAEVVKRPASTAIVVMTHHFEQDTALVESALRLRPMYVGLLGSRSRSARIAAELRGRDERLDFSRLHAPTGLDVGSETIEEIGLSIVAEIQAVRRGAQGAYLRDTVTPVHGRGSARVAAVVLAAGGSKRMGRPKLLLEGDEGASLIQQTLGAVGALELQDLIVVTGAETVVGELAVDRGARTVVNDEWEEGLGGSISRGMGAVGDDIDAVLVMLADQPRIRRHDLESLVSVWRGGAAPVVATSYPEGGGVPAIFARSLFDELRSLEGDRGARDLIRSLEDVELVQLSDTRDVDDPRSYAEITGRPLRN